MKISGPIEAAAAAAKPQPLAPFPLMKISGPIEAYIQHRHEEAYLNFR